jgi:hypothetical protein
MSLQATVLLDIGNNSQTLTYSLNGSQIDHMIFANNQITLESSSSFNLSKSDLLIYISSLNAFNNDLILNFPSILNYRNATLPLSTFQLSLTNLGVEHINYIQTSQGNSVYNINYVPLAQAAAFSSRSPVVITLQEFFTLFTLQNIYASQIELN